MVQFHLFDIGFIAWNSDQQTDELLPVGVEFSYFVKHNVENPLPYPVQHKVIRATVIGGW